MKAATLFSGIGAPEQARPDWAWLWSAEIDPFASAVLAARHPHSVNLGNVASDDFAERALAIGRPDIVVFGSPCQSFSVAGKRLGLDDPRGNLALVALEVVRRVRPRWFLFENVPGLLSSERGEDFAAFLGALAECGYYGAWRVLDAQYFGLAQRRERVFFVGSLGDWRGPAAVLFEREGLQGHPAPRREAGQRITGGTPVGALSCNTGPRGHDAGNFACNQAVDAGHLIAIAPTLDASFARLQGCSGQDLNHGHGHLISSGLNDGHVARALNGCHTASGRHDISVDTFVATPMFADCCEGSNGAGIGKAGDPAFCLDRKAAHQAVALCEGAHGLTEMAATTSLQSGGGKPGQGYQAIRSGVAVRRLTPRECERLQGFPDDYTLVSHRKKPAADGNRYKALGNSMAVPVLRWLLTRVEAVDRASLAQSARAAA